MKLKNVLPGNLALVIAVLLPVAFFQESDDASPLTEKEFTELHAQLVPPAAKWRTIPWQTSLIEAQNLAAKEGKPIFIWSMDGHPLGCT